MHLLRGVYDLLCSLIVFRAGWCSVGNKFLVLVDIIQQSICDYLKPLERADALLIVSRWLCLEELALSKRLSNQILKQ